jgi:hypothetical protein
MSAGHVFVDSTHSFHAPVDRNRFVLLTRVTPIEKVGKPKAVADTAYKTSTPDYLYDGTYDCHSSSTGRAFKSISHFIIIQKGFRNRSIPKPFCLQSGGIRMEAFFILYPLLFLIF